MLGDALEGEAREMGTVHGRHRPQRRARTAHPLAAPAVLLSGGETTVTLGHGPAGRGGRNTEFLLGLAVALDGAPGIWAHGRRHRRGRRHGRHGRRHRHARHAGARARARPRPARDCWPDTTATACSTPLGDLVRTGPTLTNVNDIRAILIG